MEWWLGVTAAAALLLGVGPVAFAAWARRRRWGRVIDGYEADGVGPYRATSRALLRDRGLPRRIGAAAGLGYAWGIVTILIFAPAGLLLGLAGADTQHQPVAWLFLGPPLVAISGFGIGAALFVAATDLLHRRDPDRIRAIARASTIHHLVVLGTFLALTFIEPGAELFVGTLAIVGAPCAFGIFHAWMLRVGADRMRALDAEDEKTENATATAPWAVVTR